MHRKSNILALHPHSQHTEDGTESLRSACVWNSKNQHNYSPRLSRIQSFGIGLSPRRLVVCSLHTGIGTGCSCPCISACSPRVSAQSQKIKHLNRMAQVHRSEQGRHSQCVLQVLRDQQGNVSRLQGSLTAIFQVLYLSTRCYHDFHRSEVVGTLYHNLWDISFGI